MAPMGPTPPPSWATVFGTWQPSWVVDALILVAAVAYALGVRAFPGSWPARRSAAFAAALVGLVVTFDSGIATYGHMAFAVHMIMHLMLIMVVPVLLVAGHPVELLRARFPRAVDAVVGSRTARRVFFPATVLVVYALVVVLTHLTGFMESMAASEALHHLEQVLYLVAGYLFFATALGVDVTPYRPSYFGRFLLMLLTMGVDTLVGVVLMLGPSPFPAYLADDVHLGGAIMWVGGDALMMLIMVLLGRLWVDDRSDRVDFGPWFESARRAAFASQTADDGGGQGGRGREEGGIDEDDDALAAYNRMLARLDGRSGESSPR